MKIFLCHSPSMEKYYRKYNRLLLRFFAKHSKSTWDAEELAHEVFCKVIKSTGTSENEPFPESHLYTVAWSVLRDRARRDKVRQRNFHVAFDDQIEKEMVSSVEDVVVGEIQYLRFMKSLQSLKPKTRDVFVLNRYEGMTYAEIAEHMNISVSAIEKHMMKAIAKIKSDMSVKD